jgi:hypothetical protein
VVRHFAISGVAMHIPDGDVDDLATGLIKDYPSDALDRLLWCQTCCSFWAMPIRVEVDAGPRVG